MSGESVRGRMLINMVSSEFDTSHASTSITSSLELFQLPAPQDSATGLKTWADKVTYVLSQLPIADRPQDSLMSQWAYNSLKKHSLLRRTIDQYADRPTLRSFDFLWTGVEQALRESQYDTNAQSIRDDLRKGPSSPKKDTKAMVAKGSQPKGKGKKDQGSSSKETPKGKGTKGSHKTPKRIVGRIPQSLRPDHRLHLVILHYVSFSKGESVLGQIVHLLTWLVVVLLQLETQLQSRLLRQRQR